MPVCEAKSRTQLWPRLLSTLPHDYDEPRLASVEVLLKDTTQYMLHKNAKRCVQVVRLTTQGLWFHPAMTW